MFSDKTDHCARYFKNLALWGIDVILSLSHWSRVWPKGWLWGSLSIEELICQDIKIQQTYHVKKQFSSTFISTFNSQQAIFTSLFLRFGKKVPKYFLFAWHCYLLSDVCTKKRKRPLFLWLFLVKCKMTSFLWKVPYKVTTNKKFNQSKERKRASPKSDQPGKSILLIKVGLRLNRYTLQFSRCIVFPAFQNKMATSNKISNFLLFFYDKCINVTLMT